MTNACVTPNMANKNTSLTVGSVIEKQVRREKRSSSKGENHFMKERAGASELTSGKKDTLKKNWTYLFKTAKNAQRRNMVENAMADKGQTAEREGCSEITGIDS